MNKFPQDTQVVPQIAPQTSYAERQFLHTFVAGVLLPLGQAFTTGLILFIATLTLAVIVFDVVDPFKPALVIGISTFAFTYLFLQRRWLSLTAIENVLQMDLNNDDVIGEPQTVRIQLEDVKENGHYHVDIVDLPVSAEKLATLAAGLLNGLPCSEKQWTGKDRPFSSQEFRALKAEMVKHGLLAYVNPRAPLQGYALTKPGRAVMKHYIPSPTPLEETNENA